MSYTSLDYRLYSIHYRLEMCNAEVKLQSCLIHNQVRCDSYRNFFASTGYVS